MPLDLKQSRIRLSVLAYDKDISLKDISDENSVVIEALQGFKTSYSDNSDHHVAGIKRY